MSEKPVAWQTDIHSDFNACMHREYCRELKRQRDAAVEALKVLADIPIQDSGKENKPTYPLMVWNGHELNVQHVLNARAVLREIEGKS